MHPNALAMPAARKSKLPYFRGQPLIDLIGKAQRRRPRLAVIDRKRPTAVEIVLARKRTIRRIDALQGFQKRCYVDGYCCEIYMPKMPGESLAIKPAINGPWKRIILSRLTNRQWLWDRKRQKRRKLA